jgi:hypothetical protein
MLLCRRIPWPRPPFLVTNAGRRLNASETAWNLARTWLEPCDPPDRSSMDAELWGGSLEAALAPADAAPQA